MQTAPTADPPPRIAGFGPAPPAFSRTTLLISDVPVSSRIGWWSPLSWSATPGAVILMQQVDWPPPIDILITAPAFDSCKVPVIVVPLPPEETVLGMLSICTEVPPENAVLSMK